MGTITNNPTPSALSLLTEPGQPLSSLTSLVPQSVLDSASPADLVALSTAALGLQEVDSLFGGSPANEALPSNFSVLSAQYGLALPSYDTLAAGPEESLLSSLYGVTPPSPTPVSTPTETSTLSQPSQTTAATNNATHVNTVG